MIPKGKLGAEVWHNCGPEAGSQLSQRIKPGIAGNAREPVEAAIDVIEQRIVFRERRR